MKKSLGTIAIAIAGGIVALGSYQLLENSPQEKIVREIVSMPSQQVAHTSATSLPSFVQASKSSINAVVHIKTIGQGQVKQQMDPFNFFFGPGDQGIQPKREFEGSGSGVILSSDGYIVTNNHVIKGANQIEVVLNDRRTYKGAIVGKDPNTDIALIKIDEGNLPFIPMGNSDAISVGEWVLAIGNPFNLTSTVTAGIVSAKGRNINILQNQFAIESFIQTDAAVNPGNSGGALVTQNGELIGINTAIASTTGAFAGYSFAVPVNMIRKITDDLKSFGTVQRAFIGIKIAEVSESAAEENGMEDRNGVMVAAIADNGAAAEAGLKEGDIITHIENVKVNTIPKLQEIVSGFRPGDKLGVKILREGKLEEFSLTLKNKNGNTAMIKAEATVLGATLAEIDDETKKRLNIEEGVIVESISSGALMNQGIKSGFIITKIDNEEVDSAKEVESILSTKKGGVLIEGYYTNGTKAFYGFGL
jgi:serine protease Do